MPDSKPSKPWRVYGTGFARADYRGQSAAYGAVASITAAGAKATVWHWEDGRWQKYEVIEPEHVTDPIDGEGSDVD